MAALPFYILDVFTQRVHGGNQLGVIIDLEHQLNTNQMQAIARELGFAESSFIKKKTGPDTFQVRIFTPEYEVPFAGHPSLGTAYIIATELLDSPRDSLVLDLKKGRIPIQLSQSERPEQSRYTMQQMQPDFYQSYSPDQIADGIGIPLEYIDSSQPTEEVSTGLPYLIIPLKNQAALQNLTFNTTQVRDFLIQNQLHVSNHQLGLTTAFFFVTSDTIEPESNYSTRMFCLENDQMIEDAATGSANGCLLAWLLRHHQNPISARVEQGFQMGRKSYVYLQGSRRDQAYQLNVGGHVRLVARGDWIST